MTDSNIFNLNKPDQNDPLQEVLREGARKMLAAAIEAVQPEGKIKLRQPWLIKLRQPVELFCYDNRPSLVFDHSSFDETFLIVPTEPLSQALSYLLSLA